MNSSKSACVLNLISFADKGFTNKQKMKIFIENALTVLTQ